MTLAQISRRNLLSLLGGSALVVACSENPATGRSQFMLVSDEALAELGAEAWRDALARMPQAADAAMQRRLLSIGERVAAASTLQVSSWEFVVFDSPEINAFVLPGGKVGFFRGLMETAASDDEIAAVVGHEVAHVAARHAAERVSQQMALELGVSIASAALAEEYGQHADVIAGALGAGALYGVILPYSRMQELEADTLGVALMRGASFDPAGALSFWRRMADDGERAVEWLSTHPADSRRLESLAALINENA
jgi:predicted Zn-dependent protease